MAKRKKARKKPTKSKKRLYNAAYKLKKEMGDLFGLVLGKDYAKSLGNKKPRTAKAARDLLMKEFESNLKNRNFSFRDIYENILRPSGYKIENSDDPLFSFIQNDDIYTKSLTFDEFRIALNDAMQISKQRKIDSQFTNNDGSEFKPDVFMFQIDMFLKNPK